MNNKYKKQGYFYLEIKISDFNIKQRIVGDAAVGLAALAKITADIFKSSPTPKEGLEAYFDIIKELSIHLKVPLKIFS